MPLHWIRPWLDVRLDYFNVPDVMLLVEAVTANLLVPKMSGRESLQTVRLATDKAWRQWLLSCVNIDILVDDRQKVQLSALFCGAQYKHFWCAIFTSYDRSRLHSPIPVVFFS